MLVAVLVVVTAVETLLGETVTLVLGVVVMVGVTVARGQTTVVTKATIWEVHRVSLEFKG